MKIENYLYDAQVRKSEQMAGKKNGSEYNYLLAEIRAVIKFLVTVSLQSGQHSLGSWWEQPDGAPPQATTPNVLGLFGRRGVGKSTVLRKVKNLWNEGNTINRLLPNTGEKSDVTFGKLLYPAWPFRTDALKDSDSNVAVAILGWLRDSLDDMVKDNKSKGLKKKLDEIVDILLRGDLVTEYTALGEALEEDERNRVLRDIRESAYTWGRSILNPLHEFFSELRGAQSNVILLPFEDLDLAPLMGLKILDAIRLLFSHHPGVAVVICRDFNILDAAIRTHLGDRCGVKDERLQKTFAEQYLLKIVPHPVWIPRWSFDQSVLEMSEENGKFLDYGDDQIKKVKTTFGEGNQITISEAYKKLKATNKFPIPMNAPRPAIGVRWLWENFAADWIERGEDHVQGIFNRSNDIPKNDEIRSALGLCLALLIGQFPSDCPVVQSLIDFPERIWHLGKYLEPSQGKKFKMPTEDGKWFIVLDNAVLNKPPSDLDRISLETLITWKESNRSSDSKVVKGNELHNWKAQRRLNDQICLILWTAYKIYNGTSDES